MLNFYTFWMSFKRFLFWALSFSAFHTVMMSQNTDNRVFDFSELAKITHFDKSDYKGDSQFWSMVRDTTGMYYFGNNDGALVYNGQTWDKVRLPNSSGIRSLLLASDGKVYAGGYNDFGIIKKDDFGDYNFFSIADNSKINNDQLGNVWQIHEVDNYFIFRTFQGLIVLKNTISSFIPSTGSFVYSDVLNGNYYIQDEKRGIMRFDPVSKGLELLFPSGEYNNETVVSFLPTEHRDYIEIVTKRGSIYSGNLKTGTLIKKHDIFSKKQNESLLVVKKKGDAYILGTVGSKILRYIDGKIISVNQSVYSQVQDQTVLNLYEDGSDLWVLLNDGLDLITFDSFYSNLFQEGSVYDILIKNGAIYVATNNGVFFSKIPPSNEPFNFIKTDVPQGQAWSLKDLGESILVSHDLGLFEMKGTAVSQIGEEEGFWKIVTVNDEESIFLACNYNGFYLLKKEEGKCYIETKISGFQESTRDILQANEENTFWVCHGFKGVYRIKFSEDYVRVNAIDHFTDQNGLESPFNINVHRWNNDIIFSTNSGIYSFDETENKFVPYATLNDIINTSINTRKIFEFENTTWAVLDDQIGFFESSQTDPFIETNIFSNIKGDLNRGFETIVPFSDTEVLIGARSGLYAYNFKKLKDVPGFPTFISKIVEQESSTGKVSKVSLSENEYTELSNDTDMIKIEYSAPGNTPMTPIDFSYKLIDLDQGWSRWSSTSFKEYTHLPSNKYEFVVRSRNDRGAIGEEASFKFVIKPVWYKTNLAMGIYSAIILLLLWAMQNRIKNKIRRENLKAKVLLERSKKVLHLEIERLKLEKDKDQLEEDVILKSKELMNYTAQLINKKRVFAEVQDDLKELRKLLKNTESKNKLYEIFRKLHQNKIGEEYLKVYDVNFEKIHNDFFKKLKEINPKITRRELRLCAFIKMNLSNKEIAPLLNISVRGVETARYRVRKKLDIEHETSFNDFLLSL